MPEPMIITELLIHESMPILVLPLKFTVYGKDSEIDPAHKLMSHVHPDFDWFIVGQVDGPTEGILAVFKGVHWIGFMKDHGDDYDQLLGNLHDTVLIDVTQLFPLFEEDLDQEN